MTYYMNISGDKLLLIKICHLLQCHIVSFMLFNNTYLFFFDVKFHFLSFFAILNYFLYKFLRLYFTFYQHHVYKFCFVLQGYENLEEASGRVVYFPLLH